MQIANWLAAGYAPPGYYLKDFCLVKREEHYHLIHIAGTPGVSCCTPGNEIWFGHAVTSDFVEWDTRDPCFYIDPSGWDCGHVFAPFIVEDAGRYWMLYTGCSVNNCQRIGLAISDDLATWQRASDSPVIRPEHYDWAFCPADQGAACRDPHVSKWEGQFSLYYTAVTKNGHACVARASSADLLQWEDEGPAYIFDGPLLHCESSNVQELDGNYLLFFGGHHESWSYVVSDTPYGWPAQDPIPIGKNITAMEVILKQGSTWLIAYFRTDRYRLFIGLIDWAAPAPGIRNISDPVQLAAFFDGR